MSIEPGERLKSPSCGASTSQPPSELVDAGAAVAVVGPAAAVEQVVAVAAGEVVVVVLAVEVVAPSSPASVVGAGAGGDQVVARAAGERLSASLPARASLWSVPIDVLDVRERVGRRRPLAVPSSRSTVTPVGEPA